jgi:hypothetical protein
MIAVQRHTALSAGIHRCTDNELARDEIMPPAQYELATSEPTGVRYLFVILG